MKDILIAIWRSLFPHEKSVAVILTIFIIGMVLALCSHEARTEPVAMFEGGAQYLRGPAGAVAMSVEWPGPKDADFECGMFLVGGTPEQEHGVLGGQCLLVDGFWKVDLGLGLAYVNHTSHLLGSRLNAALVLRVRLPKDWYVNVRHYSNAGTTEENTGLDIFTIGRKFK